MRIIVDTNVILDILLKREPFFDASYGAIRFSAEQGYQCMVSASAVTDIYYLLHRSLKDETQAKQSLERLLRLVDVADVLSIDIQAALSTQMPDFEDAVVLAVAERYDADIILTRNAKDYTKSSSIEILTPADYLARAMQ